ncbi:unnamed protein product, partial [Notodromas monacha]
MTKTKVEKELAVLTTFLENAEKEADNSCEKLLAAENQASKNKKLKVIALENEFKTIFTSMKPLKKKRSILHMKYGTLYQQSSAKRHLVAIFIGQRFQATKTSFEDADGPSPPKLPTSRLCDWIAAKKSFALYWESSLSRA